MHNHRDNKEILHSNVLVSYRHGLMVVVEVSKVVDVTKVAENTKVVTTP